MSIAGAIRAGAAYVEVFLEQNALTRGLAAVQTRLRGWSTSLGRLGSGAYGGELPGPLGAIARFASSPAGMFAGLLTAAKTAAGLGSGGSLEEKMEGHLAQIAENTDRQNAALERLERNMNEGLLLA